jgi:biopolymer transport protein ExbD
MPEDLKQSGQNDPENEQPTPTFEDWLKEHEDVKPLYEAHTKGLKSALNTERTAREELEKQLRKLAKQADAGSDAQKELTETADKLAATERRDKFYEVAHEEGVKNLKLAWLAAQEFMDEDGEVKLDAMKKAYPELFASKQKVNVNAGDGMQNQQAPLDMNSLIRRAAGRQ